MNGLSLTGMFQEELVAFAEQLGEPSYRGRQIFAGLHNRRLRSFDEMTDLPKDLRAKLNEQATASTLTVESRFISQDDTIVRAHAASSRAEAGRHAALSHENSR